MEQRKLGTNGPLVDVIALGTWAMGGTQWGPSDDEESLAALRAGLDAGMTFLDTADTYGEGRSEEIVARAIEGRRDGLFISTKVGVLGNPTAGWKIDLSRSHILEGCEDSLKRLGADVIDLYQLHWSVEDVPIEESVGALDTLREQGKIRYAAVCNFTALELEGAANFGQLISLQSPYSMLDRRVEAADLPAAGRLGMGFLAYGPLAKGLLTGKFRGDEPTFPDGDVRNRDKAFHGEGWARSQRIVAGLDPIAAKHGKTMGQIATNWVLSQPGVTAALVGVRRPAQALEAVGGQGWTLDAQDLATIDALLSA